VSSIQASPWATWLPGTLEERITGLGWAAEWFGDERDFTVGPMAHKAPLINDCERARLGSVPAADGRRRKSEISFCHLGCLVNVGWLYYRMRSACVGFRLVVFSTPMSTVGVMLRSESAPL